MKRMHDIEITSEGVFINGTALPGGGSKLYLHHIQFRQGGANSSMDIVATHDTPMTSSNYGNKIWRPPYAICGALNSGGVPYPLLLNGFDQNGQYTFAIGYLGGNASNPTWTSVNATFGGESGFVQDTVTEL